MVSSGAALFVPVLLIRIYDFSKARCANGSYW